MYLNKTFAVKFIFFTFVSILVYCLIFFLIYFFSVASFHAKKIQEIWPLKQFQQEYYALGGGRKIFQNDLNCIDIDRKLIYKPKIGECIFNNIEFNTSLNFDLFGRILPDRIYSNKKLPGIAILGDSYAMGWGVNDNETFANILQKSTKKPIFNLAVSSYATERELKMLIFSGLLDKVDTIVIQYTTNDYIENEKSFFFKDNYYIDQSKIFEKRINKKEILDNNISYFLERFKYALKFPIRELFIKFFPNSELKIFKFSLIKPKIEDDDFNKHRDALIRILKRYDKFLNKKKVYIFYVNPWGATFKNFPQGKDTEFNYLHYIEPKFNKTHFFLIDEHLNSKGHLHIGTFLTKALNLQ
jgi:hypothetical protein